MWLSVASGQGRGEAVEVADEPITIGSGEGCRLRVPDADVAPLHASVRREDDGTLVITALAADHPVLVDGERIEHTASLSDGARIELADVPLEVSERRPAAAADAERRHQRLDEAVEEVEGPTEVEPVAGVRRRVRLATALGAVALAVAAIVGGLAAAGTFSGGGGRGASGLSVAEVVRAAWPSTVRVDVRAPGEAGRGSGWVLDAARGLVVTNFHVVNGAQRFRVTGAGGGSPATVVAAAPCEDTAVLRVASPRGLRTLALGSQRSLSAGDPVVALGFPANASRRPALTSTSGAVSVVRTSLRAPSPQSPSLPNMLQTQAPLNPGNSGGPLLDDHARLVGMNTAVLTEAGGEPIQNQSYAIGVDRLRETVPPLARGQSAGWAGFGLLVPPAKALAARHLPPGVIAGGALPGTPAARAGLARTEVLLVAINGHRLTADFASYCAAVEGLRGPTDVQLIDRPGGPPRTVRLAFG